MIIDGSYFTGMLSLGIIWDIDSDSPTRIAERDNLQSYIDRYERQYLQLVLGEDMSRQFWDYLSSHSAEDKIEKWDTLKEKLSEKGYSPLANYVYFHYVRRCGVKQAPTGTVYGSTEDRANPNNLLVSAWNDMVEMNESLFRYLCGNKGYDGFEFDKSMLEEINTMGI